MKKTIIILISIILIVGIISGIVFLVNKKAKENPKTSEEEIFSLKVDDKEIKIGMNLADANLPKANNEYEAETSELEGMEKVYTYDNYEITTHPTENGEQILTIYFLNEKISTTEGIHIGNTVEEMKQAYGEGDESLEYIYKYKKGNSTLNFAVNDNIIINIEYKLEAE